MLLLVHKKTSVQRWKKIPSLLINKTRPTSDFMKVQKKKLALFFPTKHSKGILHSTTFLPQTLKFFFNVTVKRGKCVNSLSSPRLAF